MTNPEQFTPRDAANYGSLSAWSQTTESEWREIQRGKTAGHLQTTKTGFDRIGSDIRTIIRNFTQGWTGNNQVDFSLDDLFNTAFQAKREQTQMQAAIAQLKADVTANNNSGKTLLVTVSDYGTTFPSVLTVFDTSGGGTLTNDGDTLEFSKDTGRKLFSYNVEALATDFFEVSLIVPRPLGTTWGSYGDRAIYFLGRGDATWDNYCVARLNGNKLRIGAVIAGTSTIDSPLWFDAVTGGNEVTITPGSYMTFRGGTSAGVNVFQFLVNNQPAATFVDTDNDGLVGEDYRWTGAGLENENNDVLNRVANISHFMANDNAPAPVVGSFASMCRLSTSLVAVLSGTNELPDSFFDFVTENSTDISYSLTDGTFTVSKPGSYLISATLRCGGSWPNHVQLVSFVDGIAGKHMSADFGYTSNALGGTQLPDAVHGSVPLQLQAGDSVSIGYLSDGGTPNALRGEATGNYTHFTIMGTGSNNV